MSTAYYIVLEKDEPGIKTFVNGVALAKAAPALNRLARHLGLKQIDQYVSHDLGEYFDEDEDEAFHGNLTEPREVWFEPAEGLEWTTRLVEQINASPEEAHVPDSILTDLEEYRELFERAAEAGIRWHIEVDF